MALKFRGIILLWFRSNGKEKLEGFQIWTCDRGGGGCGARLTQCRHHYQKRGGWGVLENSPYIRGALENLLWGNFFNEKTTPLLMATLDEPHLGKDAIMTRNL